MDLSLCVKRDRDRLHALGFPYALLDLSHALGFSDSTGPVKNKKRNFIFAKGKHIHWLFSFYLQDLLVFLKKNRKTL